MSTRKLIGLAVVCGLAILIAGGVQLFRIADARDDPVEVLTVGESGRVDSVEASVTEVVQRSPLVLSVAVAAGAGSGQGEDASGQGGRDRHLSLLWSNQPG